MSYLQTIDQPSGSIPGQQLIYDGTMTSYSDTTSTLLETIEKQNEDMVILKKIILELIKDDRPDLLLKHMDLFDLD